MPQIPRYEPNQVKLTGVRGRYQAANVINPVPNAIAGLGRAIDQVGDVVEQYQEAAMQTQLMEAQRNFNAAEREIENKYRGHSGKSAIDPNGDGKQTLEGMYLPEFQKARSQVAEALPERARMQFDRWAIQKEDAFATSLNNHVRNETVKHEDGVYESSFNELVSAASADPSKGDAVVEDMKLLMGRRALQRGWDETQYQDNLRKATSAVRVQQIDNMLEGDEASVRAGAALFRQYKEDGQLNAQAIASIGNKVEKAEATVIGAVTGDEVFDKNTVGMTIDDSIPYDRMVKEIEANDSLTVDQKKYSIARVKDRMELYNTQKRLNEEGVSNHVYGMMQNDNDRTEYTKVLSAIEKSGVDGKSAYNLKMAADKFYHVSEDRASDRQAGRTADLLNKKLANLQELYTMQEAYRDGKLGKMTPQDGAKYAARLGEQTDNFMAYINNVNTKLENPESFSSELNQKLRILRATPGMADAGFPNPDGNSQEEKAALAQIHQYTMEFLTGTGKGGPGKQVTLDQALNQAIKKVKVDKGWGMFGMTFGEAEKPAFTYRTWTRAEKETYATDLYRQQNNGQAPTPEQVNQLIQLLDK